MNCTTNRLGHPTLGSLRECDGWMHTPWLRDGDHDGEESWYMGFQSEPVTLRTCARFVKRAAYGDVDQQNAVRMTRYGRRS